MLEYPAIFSWSQSDAVYLVELIDFDAHTFGTDLDDAYDMAQDLLGNCAANLLADNKPLPTPSEKPKRTLKETEMLKTVVLDYDQWLSEASVLEPDAVMGELVC